MFTPKLVRRTMTNLLAQAINCDDADRAARIIQDALVDMRGFNFREGQAASCNESGMGLATC
jgi:hypothetical protein